MKRKGFVVLAFLMFVVTLATAQTRGVAQNAIPGDNNIRYYRLALPVTVSAYQQDLGSDYNNVLRFWRECEDYANRMFVPLGICFDVVEDSRLVMSQPNMIDENIYNVNFGTELTNEAVGSDTYDVGMWIHHRSEYDENTGLSIGNGAYNTSTKSNGYAKTDKWVVAHELGHMFGAPHTVTGEGSLMDSGGEFFSYPSIKKIREASVRHGIAGAYSVHEVLNSAPVFDSSLMKECYRIPQGACMSVPLYAADADGHTVTYAAIGCSSSTVDDVIEGGDDLAFASLHPALDNVVDYRPRFSADIFDDSYYYVKSGTDVPSMYPGLYSIAFLVNDISQDSGYEALVASPFYSNYAVWDAKVEVVAGTPFKASLYPQKDEYRAGEKVAVEWGVNNSYFGADSRVRITLSTDYGRTFGYVLAESVPARDGSCVVELPNVNVGNVDVDFVTAVRSMPGGIIRVEEIGGVAYTLTALSPEQGGSFVVVGGEETAVNAPAADKGADVLYDLSGRMLPRRTVPETGVYISRGRKCLIR